ncbi:MAG TPA: hypothetical protein VK592_03155 [Candidatus Dormibacteraeota bacterium]|nr:hypothetical protein [Candidatus Dormibacteraeota bacterium]
MPRGRLGRALRALIWLIIAFAISLGAAGIVTGAALPPGDATRPELTVRADQRLEPGLSAVEAGLRQQAAELDQLRATGESVLTTLTAAASGSLAPSGSPAASGGSTASADVAALLDAGDSLVLSIAQRSQALQAAYAQLPYDASSDRIGGRSKGRLLAVRAALGGLGPVADDWQVTSAKATVAARLIDLLQEHDQRAGAAVLQASDRDAAGRPKQPDPAGATTTIKEAIALLAQATTIRDQLQPTVDTAALSDWLDRLGTWDRAFQTYVHLTANSRDRRVLDAAYAVEEAARKALPKTTSGLVLVVADIGDSGLNAAVADLKHIRDSLDVVARVD